tara:strand:- start:296 stop:1114 length:819 start_codon:yes stop_codon:yes gene_type:complete
MNFEVNLNCRVCNEPNPILKFIYNKKPKLETNFNLNKEDYYREFYKCKNCEHMFSIMKMDFENIYTKLYTDSTYGKNIHKKFKEIINLPIHKSDNENRFKFIKNISENLLKKQNIKILDVGSGLGVFPWRAKKERWDVTALDPDKNNIKHIKENINIKTIQGDFLKTIITEKYDIITFNKVLEHLKNPIEMLIKAKKNLKKKSFIYVEVPSVVAAKKGKNREEFFIEHFHVFSRKSLQILSRKCKLNSLNFKTLIEPSGKYTLRGVLVEENI